MMKPLISFCVACFLATSAFATKVETTGNIKVKDQPYSFQMKGLIRIDNTWFMGKKSARMNDFPSGANLRSADIGIDGEVHQDWDYHINASFAGSGVDIDDAYIGYRGLAKNVDIKVGQIPSPFCLENSNSSKWLPFLERSLPANTFRPCMGIGVSVNAWTNDFAFTVAASAPKLRTRNDQKYGSDKITSSGRLTFSPMHESGNVYHIGLTGIVSEVEHWNNENDVPLSDLSFSTDPEAKGRRTAKLVDTGKIRSSFYYVSAIELARLYGPWFVQGEYFWTKVNRKEAKNVQFNGWYVQGAYVITGETRDYNFQRANFGRIRPESSYGAWELAARFSMLDLNDKDVHGGREHNTTLALSWYMNDAVRLMTNYIWASIHPKNQAQKRTLHIVGARLQVVW